MHNKIVIICVDRDNDLGRKAKINGPVIGIEKNIEAAKKLLLIDPCESDGNTIFAAVKKLEESKKYYPNSEVVTITGHGKSNLQSDKEINKQLDIIQKQFLIQGWILVTDGDEDNQVIPLLQSRAKIISTEQVIIKQAKTVESTFYTLKEAIKDPTIARTVFGIPGIIIIAYILFGNISIQAMAFILGVYLLLKGFGIEEKIINTINILIKSIKEQRISVILYTLTLVIPIIGLILMFIQLRTSEFIDITIDLISSIKIIYPFLTLGAISLMSGKIIDAIYDKKAYKIGKYLIQSSIFLSIWLILDSSTLFFLRQTNLNWISFNIIISLIIIIIALNLAKIFDINKRINKTQLDSLVINRYGEIIGKVIEIDKRNQNLTYQTDKNSIKLKKNQFKFIEGKVVLNDN
jgi:putative membrane protein